MAADVAADISKKRCFVVTPLGDDHSDERRHANMVFEVALRPNLERTGYTLERADVSTGPNQITAAIFSALNEAELCVADLTFLNPNVMYELGVRHALQKPVIQIAQKGTRLPFDTANQQTLFFDPGDFHSLQKLGSEVLEQVEWIDNHPGQISNPLTSALGIFANAANADPQANLINQLVGRVRALETSMSAAVAPAIIGQGDLATKNTNELKQLWRIDQKAQSLGWADDAEGQQVAEYRGFKLWIASESKGRWSSSATEEATGYSVPWPVWQSSSDDAKTTIVRAVDAALAERDP